MSSLSFRNNNPGNLRYGSFAQEQGATGPDGHNFAIFETSAKGFKAMVTLLAGHTYGALTLREAIARYAPSNDNNEPEHYAKTVGKMAGVALDTRLGDLSCPQLAGLAWAMAMFEGWQP